MSARDTVPPEIDEWFKLRGAQPVPVICKVHTGFGWERCTDYSMKGYFGTLHRLYRLGVSEVALSAGQETGTFHLGALFERSSTLQS